MGEGVTGWSKYHKAAAALSGHGIGSETPANLDPEDAMKTLFAMAVVALVGCGPDLQDPSGTGQASQGLALAPPERVEVPSVPDRGIAPTNSPQEALVAPEPRTFLNSHIYDTGIKP